MVTKNVHTTVDGHRIRLSHPDKQMFPAVGFTKRDLVDYYTAIAPVLLPHLDSRPLTRIRWPNGVTDGRFFEKNAPAGTPEWVRTELIASPGSTKDRTHVDYVVAQDTATLVWLANLAALELHTPQWRIDGDEEERRPDRLVADLDPGEPADITDCARVALLLRDRFARDGLTSYAKTSGKKGIHVCCPISGEQPHQVVSDYVKTVAQELEREHGDLIVSKMLKKLRHGKVFIDWSQNNAAKTTVSVYSLRAAQAPTVSIPVTWDEVESGAPPVAGPEEALARVDRDGDGFAPLLVTGPPVPVLTPR